MLLNSKDIFDRLLGLYKTKKLNELSILLGFKKNWGSSVKNRGSIPFEACIKACEEFDVSMDYLIFGIEDDSKKIDINELKISVTEGIFAAIQTDMITLNKDVKISHITEIITSEIKEICKINDENQKLDKAQ
ncbi:helix-turn-helix domain-containing protein [Colwellia sp. RE-S-Sl-9]